MQPKISIYVAYHKPSPMPAGSSIHYPVHVGRALSKQQIAGTIGDDTGDNISSLNPLFCEITATYWAWKNDHQSDYIGICHYRRFFSYDRPNAFRIAFDRYKFFEHKLSKPHHPHTLVHRKKCKTAESFLCQITKFENDLKADLAKNSIDIFYLSPARCNVELELSGAAKTQQTREIIKEHFPEFYPFVDKVYHSKQFSYANMVIMKRELFDQYCTFLFGVLNKHRQMGYSEQEESRLYGYIAENLTDTFIEYKKATSGSVVRELSSTFYKGN